MSTPLALLPTVNCGMPISCTASLYMPQIWWTLPAVMGIFFIVIAPSAEQMSTTTPWNNRIHIQSIIFPKTPSIDSSCRQLGFTPADSRRRKGGGKGIPCAHPVPGAAPRTTFHVQSKAYNTTLSSFRRSSPILPPSTAICPLGNFCRTLLKKSPFRPPEPPSAN